MKDVTVVVENDGTVSYSISGGSVDEVEGIQNMASQDEFASQITENLVENDSGVIIEAITSNDEIELVISATLDTTDATGTTDVKDGVSDLTQELGLSESTIEGNLWEFDLNEKYTRVF